MLGAAQRHCQVGLGLSGGWSRVLHCHKQRQGQAGAWPSRNRPEHTSRRSHEAARPLRYPSIVCSSQGTTARAGRHPLSCRSPLTAAACRAGWRPARGCRRSRASSSCCSSRMGAWRRLSAWRRRGRGRSGKAVAAGGWAVTEGSPALRIGVRLSCCHPQACYLPTCRTGADWRRCAARSAACLMPKRTPGGRCT